MQYLRKYRFFLSYCFVLVPLLGIYIAPLHDVVFANTLFLCSIIVDYYWHDPFNLSKEQELSLLHDNFYKLLTYFFVPIQIALIGYGMYLVHTYPVSWYQFLALVYGVGLITGGIGITLAHELLHKDRRIDQFLSKILLISTCYGHFFIYHKKGHHVWVATPEDPVTARLGDSYYYFILRSVAKSFRMAVTIEKQRLAQKGQSFWSYNNQLCWAISGPILIVVAAYWYGGFITVAFFLLQAIVAIAFLEVINYLQHYGLMRRQLANGGYEKVNSWHSWNANNWLSNSVLFQLPLHSSHHLNGTKPYQALQDDSKSPQLPGGYFQMAAIALFPPLWRLIMDKRVAYYEQLREQEEPKLSQPHAQ